MPKSSSAEGAVRLGTQPEVRIAIANWTARRVGGVERYLTTVLTELERRGHVIHLFVEMDEPKELERIGSDVEVTVQVGTDGKGLASGLSRWCPDIVFMHAVRDTQTEAALQAVAPAVLMTHAYYGTCISGTKTRSFPRPEPCTRTLGPGCFAQYYPRRCGGLSPLTMLRDFRTQTDRRALLAGYQRVIANSLHLAAEYHRHGVPAEMICSFPMPVVKRQPPLALPQIGSPDSLMLLFAGRMDELKGGELAIRATPRIANELGRPVRLTMAGEGPERASWEEIARAVEANSGPHSVRIEFPGWLDDGRLKEFMREADLLLMPSLWPEPFGLIGVEAAACGLPCVAFAVGGIPEWLGDGVNGHLADHPHDHRSLASAAVLALADPTHHLALRRGATEVALRFEVEAHVDLLEAEFLAVAEESHGDTEIA